jgi:hypothetical protein
MWRIPLIHRREGKKNAADFKQRKFALPGWRLHSASGWIYASSGRQSPNGSYDIKRGFHWIVDRGDIVRRLAAEDEKNIQLPRWNPDQERVNGIPLEPMRFRPICPTNVVVPRKGEDR